jgi:hypothetical protein
LCNAGVTPGTSFNKGTDLPRPQPQREALGTTDAKGVGVVVKEAEGADDLGERNFRLVFR